MATEQKEPKLGLVRVTAQIGSDADHLRDVRFLVDTGSFYTLLSSALAAELGVETPLAAPVVMAYGRTATIRQGMAYLKLMDREAGVPIAVMPSPEPLLGVTALEALGLKVNPVKITLEYDSELASPPAFHAISEPSDA